MKKNAGQLCDNCKRKSTCQDYADNMRMRQEGGLVISIVDCDMHLPERPFVEQPGSVPERA